MKLAVYTKEGQVGLTEIDRPQIIEADDAIIRIVRTCVCGSDLWRYRSPDIEAGHQNSGHEAIGIVEEIGDAVTTVKPGDLLLLPLLMDAGNVMPAEQDLTVPVILILGITGQMGCRQNICASNLLTGL